MSLKASAFAEAFPLPLTRFDFGCIIKKNSECGDKIPVVGEFADVAKLYRAGDNLIDAAKVADNAIDAAKVADNVYDYSKYPKTIHSGRQGKHIVGHNNYEKGKSVLTIAEEKAKELLEKFSGKGTPVSDTKERIDFGEVIGKYIDPKTGKAYDTTNGMVTYSKDGAHIVPARPTGYNG